MYENYWNLDNKPFKNTPDSRFFYFSRQHEEALTRMLFTVTEDKGAMVLTGDVGCGKTLLSRALIEQLDPERYDVALLPHPNLNPVEFVQEVLHQFGYPITGCQNKAELLRLLDHCLRNNQKLGRKTIVIVDEAQMVLDPNTLEEIRLLLNFQQSENFLLTIFLLGQPELRAMLDDLPQLAQRLAVRYHLHPLNTQDSHEYLRHRLTVAGTRHELFTSGAETLIVQFSQGVPRQMNNLGDMSLMVGYGQKAPIVDESIVRQVAAAMEF